MPSTIVGYKISGQTLETSSYIVTADTISTWTIDKQTPGIISGNVAGKLVYGILSTVWDNFDFEIPSTLYPNQNNNIILDTVISSAVNGDISVLSSIGIWNPSGIVTSFIIPVGTEVTSHIEPGTTLTCSWYVDNLVPVTRTLCKLY